MSGEIIPYHGWGLVVLIVIALLCVVAFILSLKYADKLNQYFSGFIDKITGVFNKKREKNGR
jgi:hypothetical protein